ncbi:MAG: phosphatase PAP2 family protein [Deltaproteobacteria bacterium]|nr:phosphatase PAP2 family protein [Deltaproteobacteria bacterium]
MHNENNNTVKRYLLIFILISVSTIIILFFFDTQIWLAARNLVSREPYYSITDLITDNGLYLFYAAFIVLFAYALIKKNKKLTGLLLAYIKAQLIFALALVRILKIILGRARPEHGSEFTFFSFAFRYNSFPSGHSADAFISGVFLFYLLKHSKYSACRYFPLIYAFLIAISRVFISSHYPSDVAAGMLIGILGGWFFISRLNDQKHHLNGRPK